MKHLILTKRVRFDPKTHLQVAPSAYGEGPYGVGPYGAGEIRIAAVGQTWSALKIADGCVKYWEQFLRNEALMPS